MTTREQAYAALLTRLQTLVAAGAVKIATRSFTLSQAVKPPELPAIFMEGDAEEIMPRPNLPPKRRLTVRLLVHVAVPGDQVAGTVLSAMLDQIDSVLAPPPGQTVQTLGGLVAHCWIEGVIERFEIGKPNHANALIPVHILVP